MTEEHNTAEVAQSAIDAAYAACISRARGHYENFPVASLLLPRRLRRPVAAVYAFARTADDFADEGEHSTAERLALLENYRERLLQTAAGRPPDEPTFIALADLLRRFEVPATLFADLLDAFRQDVTKTRYDDFAEVLDYCRRSANPVGRILLHLHGSASAENLADSDRICSALQLINFWQDLAQDYDENDRIYLPAADMARFSVTETHLAERRNDTAMRALMAFQYRRTREMMLNGAPLAWRLKGRFGLELRLIVAGGLRVLDRLEQQPDCFARPRLRGRDTLSMLRTALRLGHPVTPNTADA